MTEFKVGDTVRLINAGNEGGVKVGSVGVVKEFRGGIVSMIYINFPTNDDWGLFAHNANKYLQLVEKTMDNLQPGDILEHTDEYNDDQTVVALVDHNGEKIVVVAEYGQGNWYYDANPLSEYKEDGWTVAQIKEVTLGEIADKFGVTISKIRIKE